MTAKEKISKARAGLILDAPFFGSIALKHRLKEDPACKTAWINGREIGYNPIFIEGLPLDQVKGLLAHEVLHIAAAHHARRQERDARRWNVAGDHAINQALIDSGFRLPPAALPGIPDTAEAIYSRIPEPQDDNPDPGETGEVRDAPGDPGDGETGDAHATSAQLAQAEAESKIMTAQAAQLAGKLPASLARLIDEILQPRVNWSDILRRFIESSAKNDYSWSRPNRRLISQGIFLPGLHSDEIGNVAIAVDTSGSVGARMLNEFAAEISGILDAYDTTTHIIYCDSEIDRTEIFTRQDLPLHLNPTGGGGTSFAPPFAWIENAEIRPACMVYLTDGGSNDYPEFTPEYPVLWAVTDGFATHFKPPFGEVINIQ